MDTYTVVKIDNPLENGGVRGVESAFGGYYRNDLK